MFVISDILIPGWVYREVPMLDWVVVLFVISDILVPRRVYHEVPVLHWVVVMFVISDILVPIRLIVRFLFCIKLSSCL